MEQNERASMTRQGNRLAHNIWRIGAAGAVAILGFLAVAAYAMFVSLPGHVRVAPVSIVVHSASSLPAEVQALEAQTAPFLFDRDTTTAHVAYADQSIDTQLDRLTEIQSIKVFGAAPYELTVQAQQGSAWNTITGLSKLKLSNQPAGWNNFQATQAVTTGALRFLLTLPSGNGGGGGGVGKGKGGGKGNTTTTTTATTGGLPEIEIWATGEHALINGAALVAAMPSGTQTAPTSQPKPAQARAYAATPSSAVVGKDAQTFSFTLDRPANRFKRAWLAYEAYGLAHWVSPVRRINGLSLQGGAFTFSGSDWTQLTEPIQPDWLVAGNNRIDFSMPANLPGNYSVRNVRIVAELDDGNNFIARATTTVGGTAKTSGTETDASALIDGDLTTGWSPYVDPHSKGGNPALTLYFDKPTQLDTLSLNLVNALSGTLSVDLLVGGQWQSAGIQTINGKKLTTGWNSIPGFAQVAADALRITFMNGTGSPGEISEIAASGSGTGTAYVPAINVTYPDAGQFYGRQAYIRGFLSVADNGTGPAVVTIGGKSVPNSDGSFGLVVSKDDVGFANQADAEPWQVEIDALYPNGQKLIQIVKLTQANDASKAHGLLPAMVNPGFAEMMVGGDASLDIGPVALDQPIDIKITPLADKDLPALDPGMTNVTPSPKRGYRFTPHGAHFKKDIKVTIPYDPALIPAGLTETDVKTFYFDTTQGHWVELTRYKIDLGKHKVTSLTNHFTDMISATLTVPDHPETASYNATQMKDIKAADPGAGINLIEPPKPNNMGDARLSYPIEIPQGRQGMQPQLAISYNSSGGNGWLGLGWDLSVPSITIDTRWGVPRYDTVKETETYMLNGEMLIPVNLDGTSGTMAHRSTLLDRTSTSLNSPNGKIFHTRVEGAFRKIIRHGTTPTTYWWEVIDKNGTKNFYGGDGTSQDAGSILGSANGVFKWALKQTVDTHKNTVNYSYAKMADTGVLGGSVMGYQLYIQTIDYTGTQGGTGPYTVTFVRDRDVTGYVRRADVQIDARGGFKQVTADLLRKIEVRHNADRVRSYELVYKTGAFNKSLLDHVVQYGNDGTSTSNGTEFNRHVFAYYDEARDGSGNYNGFTALPSIDTGTDSLSFASMGGPFAHTVLGGTEGQTTGFDGYAGVGFLGTKMFNVGVAPSMSRSKSKGSNSFVDVDGDGLPDKIFITDSGSFYRRNTTSPATPGQVSFASGGNPQPVSGFARPQASESDTMTLAVQGFLFGISLNGSKGITHTRDMSYLADVNGDGLVDVVNRGSVLFNTAKSTGGAVGFSGNSYDTTVPLGAVGGAVSLSVLPDVSADKAQFEAANPLMDNVRRWVAPYDGVVRVTGGVQLIDFATDPRFTKDQHQERQAYTQADGVRVAIQQNTSELWFNRIKETDYNEHQPDPAKVGAIPVKKGDRIYFRVQSVYDGAYDLVKWSPAVEYVGNNATLSMIDADNRNAYRFQAAEDFIMANRALELAVPYRGTVRLAGTLNKTATTSDDVSLRVTVTDHAYINGTPTSSPPKTVLTKKIAWDYVGPITLSDDFEVKVNSGVNIDFVVDSQIDLTSLKWGDLGSSASPRPGLPQLYYTAAYQDAVTPLAPATIVTSSTLPASADAMKPKDTTGMAPILDAKGNAIVIPALTLVVNDANGNPKYTMPVKYGMDIYSENHLSSPQTPWVAPKDGMILWTPWVKLKTYPQTDPNTGNTVYATQAPNGEVTMTAKRAGAKLAKQVVLIQGATTNPDGTINQGGTIVESSQGYNGVQVLQVKAGDKIFFDASMRDPAVESQIDSASVDISYASNTPWQVPISDNVNFTAHIEGSAPLALPDDPPVDGRAMFVIRKGDGMIAYSQIVDFTKTPVIDIAITQPVNKSEKWYFDVFTINPSVTISANQARAQYSAAKNFSVPFNGQMSFVPVLNFQAGVPDGNVTLTVLQNGTPLAQQTYAITNGSVVNGAVPLSAAVTTGEVLTFAYSTGNYVLSSYLSDKGAVTLDYQSAANKNQLANWAPQTVGSASFTIAMPTLSALQTGQVAQNHYSYVDPLFGSAFHGWSNTGYNGSGALAALGIKEGLLVMSSKESDYKDPNKQWSAWPVYPMLESGQRPIVASDRWGNQDDRWWTTAFEASASRKGLDNIYDPRKDSYTEDHHAGFANAARPARMSHSDIDTMGIGFYLSVTQSENTMTSDLDVMDMNGDRFPDIIGPSGTQYTWADGTFYNPGGPGPGGPARSSTDTSTSFGLSPGGPSSPASGKGELPPQGFRVSNQASSIPVSPSASMGDSKAQYDLLDINGDGLPDRVSASGGALMVQLNTGYGFAAPENWASPPGSTTGISGDVNTGKNENIGASFAFAMWNGAMGGGISVGHGHNYTHLTLMDINGDGLNDVVSSQGGNLDVWLNTGAGFANKVSWPGAIDSQAVTDGGSSNASLSAKYGFSFTVWFINISFSFAGNEGETISQPTTSYVDVDGDGFVDGVRSHTDNQMVVALNKIGKTNLLKSVNRPLGAEIDVEYTRDGNTYLMPQSRWVMSRVSVNDGFAGDGVDVQETTYKYKDGNYNRYERDFYGYRTVSEEHRDVTKGDSVYRKVVSTYLNGNYYDKGLELSEQTFDGSGNIYLGTVNTYSLRDIFGPAGNTVVPTDLDGYATSYATNTFFPMLVTTERNFYEGGQGNKGTYTTQVYDDWGNITNFKDAGDEGDADDVIATIGYSTYCKDSSYVIGKPLTIVVKGAGQIMRTRTGTLEDCTSGNIKQLSQDLGNGSAAVTDLTYEANGNLSTITGPANLKGDRYKLTYAYDTAVSTYVASVSDSFGYSSAATYDYNYGKPLTSTDLNNNVISYVYDNYGRTTSVKGPYEQAGSHQTLVFDYRPEAAVPYATTQHLNLDAKGSVQAPIETVLFTDGLKRVLQTKKSVAVNGTAMLAVSGRVLFDAMGRTIKQYYPVTEAPGQDGIFNPAFDSINPTVTTYDILDRSIKTTLPDSTSTSIEYGFGSDRNGATQFKTTVTDANKKTKESYRDIGQLITSVKEYNKGNGIWTSYKYDPLKQITEVSDAKGNLTKATYDNLGRRTSLDNLDTGKTVTVYDQASNVVQKITANLAASGKAINYVYDYNRLAAIHYPDYTGNNVTYEYGAAGLNNGLNQIGRIVKVTDASGTEERAYGKLGETVKEIRTIASHTQGNSANSPEVYTTQYKYDTFGRILTLTLPDTEIITYGYDNGGNLANFAGDKQGNHTQYLQSLLYDKFEQRTYLKLGNGVDTTYTYNDKNRRLTNLLSQGTVAGKFQNLNYAYDSVGNILGLANDTAIPAPSGMGGPTSQCFGYDDLYRLTSATGKFQSSPDKTRNYTLVMGYNDIHNIVAKTQTDNITNAGGAIIPQKATSYDWAYAYTGSQPHAPTHIGTHTFSYDADGNQLGWTDDKNGTRRIMLWDEDNRIAEIDDNGERSKYTYDDKGERIIKTGRQGETVYVNQYYVVRNRSIVSKHLFAGTSRLVTRMVMGTAPGNSFQGSGSNPSSFATGGTSHGNPSTNSGQAPGQGHGNQGNAYGHDKENTGQGNAQGQGNNASSGNIGENADHGKSNAQDHGNSNSLARNAGEGGVTNDLAGVVGQPSQMASSSISEGAVNLPGNSEKGLENALANGQGNKYGIYKHLAKEGDTVDASGEIVASGSTGSGTGSGTGGGTTPTTNGQSDFTYYYHPDHLGSTGYVTDANGKLYEHLEYFPFGETWVQEHSNTLRTQYLFTGKELDQETGLYYFGARYYDPRTSVWQSADPILEKFLPSIEEGRQKDGDAGGVFNSRNLGMYSYSYNRPTVLRDPDGRCPICIYVLIVYADEILIGSVITAEIAGGASVMSAGPSSTAKAVVNEASALKNVAIEANAVKNAATEVKAGAEAADVVSKVKATVPYKRPSGSTTIAQRESVQGKPCVKCGAETPKQVAGHKEALVKEHYETGTIDKEKMRSLDAVQPECPTCSAREGAEMSRYSREMKKELD